jgi:RHS repeat-associated protein
VGNSYDWRNLPVKFNKSGPTTVAEMTYDAGGNRVLKREYTASSKLATAYVDEDIVFENPDPAVPANSYKMKYISINTPFGTEGQINASTDGLSYAGAYYFIKDHLGSTRTVINNQNTRISADRYTAYGEIRNLAVGTERMREQFTGKEFDKEGGLNLYYFGARYYDPVVGVWTSPDPIEDFWNGYSYVGGNPINYIDPWGLEHTPDGGSFVMDPVDVKGDPSAGPDCKWGGEADFFSGNRQSGESEEARRERQRRELQRQFNAYVYQDVSKNSNPIAAPSSGTYPEMDEPGIQDQTLTILSMLPFGIPLKAAKVAETAKNSTTLFRSVSKVELDDIVEFGLRTKQGGYELSKLFATTLTDAARFGKNNFQFDKIANHLIKVEVPNSVIRDATFFTADGMKAVSIPANQLVNIKNITPYTWSPLIK